MGSVLFFLPSTYSKAGRDLTMKNQTMEKLYVGVMIACFLVCLVLLISMIVGQPLLQRAYPHAPTMRDTILPPQLQEEEGEQQTPPKDQTTGQTGRFTLTETALQQTLLSALPESFPVSALEADIDRDCTIELKLEIKRNELISYLERAGMKLSLKQKLFLRLLPKTLAAECLLQLSQPEDGGLVLLTPQKLSLNEHSVNVSAIPVDLITAVNQGMKTALEATGLTLGGFTCTDDAIIFE